MKVYRNVSGSGDSLLVVNKETLTGSKVLTVADIVIQWLDPGGASRDVTFPAEADSLNLMFWIYNDADGAGENLVVKNDGATTLATLGPGTFGIFSCDGTDWKWLNNLNIYYDSVNGRIGFNTFSPLYSFHIITDEASSGFAFLGTSVAFGGKSSLPYGRFFGEGTVLGVDSYENGSIQLLIAGSEKIRITDDNIIFKEALCFDPQTATGDGTTTIDWNDGNKFHFTWGAQAETFTFIAPSTAASLLLKMTQDGVGSRDATWPAAVTWLGTEPTWTDGGAGKTIAVSFYYDGTTYWGQGTDWET